MKALVGAFNQEIALVGAFSVIVKTDCETDGSSAALVITRRSKQVNCLMDVVQELDMEQTYKNNLALLFDVVELFNTTYQFHFHAWSMLTHAIYLLCANNL